MTEIGAVTAVLYAAAQWRCHSASLCCSSGGVQCRHHSCPIHSINVHMETPGPEAIFGRGTSMRSTGIHQDPALGYDHPLDLQQVRHAQLLLDWGDFRIFARQ